MLWGKQLAAGECEKHNSPSPVTGYWFCQHTRYYMTPAPVNMKLHSNYVFCDKDAILCYVCADKVTFFCQLSGDKIYPLCMVSLPHETCQSADCLNSKLCQQTCRMPSWSQIRHYLRRHQAYHTDILMEEYDFRNSKTFFLLQIHSSVAAAALTWSGMTGGMCSLKPANLKLLLSIFLLTINQLNRLNKTDFIYLLYFYSCATYVSMYHHPITLRIDSQKH